MADWTKLPEDLLNFIAKHLESSFDVNRFRAVCSTWRSSVGPPKRHRLPPRFPVFPHDSSLKISSGFYLSKRRIFLLKSGSNLESGRPGWLIKTEEDSNVSNKIQLLNPLGRSRVDSISVGFPKVLNLFDFRFLELGQEYVLHYINYPENSSVNNLGNLHTEKVVLFCKDELNDFMLLTIHVSGKLAIFQSVPKIWTVIQDMPSPYDDVIFYKGNFYAVDNTGRIVLVAMDLSISLIAEPVFGGDKKFLVESMGELLLVDMYLSIEDDSSMVFVDGDFEHLSICMSERTVRFKVFKLDEATNKWVRVKNLGDQVLFLGDDCTFSASAKDLCLNRGNCIFFADNFFYLSGEDNGAEGKFGLGVFDLENRSIGPVEKFPQCLDLFWPPPRWISSTESEVSG